MNELETKEPAGSSIGRRITLLVTNATKLAGLGLALNEVFVQPHPRTLEIFLSAFMMAGAQISEETVLSLWGRLFEPGHGSSGEHK